MSFKPSYFKMLYSIVVCANTYSIPVLNILEVHGLHFVCPCFLSALMGCFPEDLEERGLYKQGQFSVYLVIDLSNEYGLRAGIFLFP